MEGSGNFRHLQINLHIYSTVKDPTIMPSSKCSRRDRDGSAAYVILVVIILYSNLYLYCKQENLIELPLTHFKGVYTKEGNNNDNNIKNNYIHYHNDSKAVGKSCSLYRQVDKSTQLPLRSTYSSDIYKK